MDVTTERAMHVHKGAKVYLSDGSRIGKAGDTRLPRAIEGETVGPSRPPGNPNPVHGEAVDLDITGTLGPLAGSQPSQATMGAQPLEPENERLANVAGSDVGTDYKELGETADPRGPSATRDERIAHGYFKVNTGLDSADLYLPLSAVRESTRERVTLNVGREQINESDWGNRPPEHLFDTEAEARDQRRNGGSTGRSGSVRRAPSGASHIEEPMARDGDEHHIVPVRTYVVVFGALLGLTFLTILAANFDLGGVLNEVVAVGIAAGKAALVVLFFMHVRHSTPLMRIVVSAGFVFFSIMVLFTMGDFASRDWRSTPPRSLEVGADGFAAPVPTDRAVVSPQPTGAPGQDELVPRGTANPGR